MIGAIITSVPICAASFAASALVSYLGFKVHALTRSGGIAAWLVGGSILAFGGLEGALLLVLFFLSSTALSFLFASDPRKRRASEMFEKGGKRDAAQVLANGGVAALAAVLSSVGARDLFFAASVGALAAATADTWATEIGVLSRSHPRSLTTGKRVEPGTSGGVTALGSAASVGGAFVLGGAAALLGNAFHPVSGAHASLLLIAGIAGGLGGSLFDSLLGATVQASYRCPRCDRPAESRVHSCGTTTLPVSGIRHVNNDVVNFAATLFGALAGAGVVLLFG